MPKVGERLLKDEIVKMTSCDHCNTDESLNVKVYSKFFVLKFIVFALSKRVHIECTSCYRVEKDADAFPRRTKDRIEAILEDAKNPWYFYSGYAFLAILVIAMLTQA